MTDLRDIKMRLDIKGEELRMGDVVCVYSDTGCVTLGILYSVTKGGNFKVRVISAKNEYNSSRSYYYSVCKIAFDSLSTAKKEAARHTAIAHKIPLNEC